MSDKCPVCSLDVPDPSHSDDRGKIMNWYSCQRCGDYRVETTLGGSLPAVLNMDHKKVAVLSHWIRTRHESIVKEPPGDRFLKKTTTLDQELVESIIKRPPPNPAEQADKLVRWIGDNIEYADNYIEVKKPGIEAIVGAINESEFYFVLGHLEEEGIISTKAHVGGGVTLPEDVTLSFRGWEHYEELKLGISDSRKAFMAMEYGDELLDKIVEDVFKPAVKGAGFGLFKLVDRPPRAGLIDDRLRFEIQTSRFLIADLTHENAGAYWEAGYAEGLGKPVIYTCEKAKFEEQKTHFDTNHHLTVF